MSNSISLPAGAPVGRRNALETRRIDDAHEPLRPAVIGLAVAADPAVAPRLPGAPFDDFVEILLLIAVQQVVHARRQAGAADVDMDDDVALRLDVPIHRSHFAPKEL